ncbi:uncharacterized protein LOC134821712 isoform X2 [Bolinopsis microptera]|uniref:uncharacterized protein LOC134821712 isoform X2 n=1 Tax=Bolinopsis microptera TaxID=2820187 RepID=UPI0030797721
MARSNHNREDSNPDVTNGFPCHENGITLCSHASKRKRLQKPKIIKENDSAQIVVEKLLKTENCVNGGKKPQTKPCRRSERKIIPSSLWDNAVINPFFERKRRKLTESPIKSPPNLNGSTSSDKDNKIAENNPKSNGVSAHNGSELLPDKSLDTELNNSEQDSAASQSEVSSSKELGPGMVKKVPKSPFDKNSDSSQDSLAAETQRHVRLRRSSRKHSSSISSISDSKYTIKQELVLKINAPDLVDVGVDQALESKSEEVEMDVQSESTDCKDESILCDEKTLPLQNGNCNEHETELEHDEDSKGTVMEQVAHAEKDVSPEKIVTNKKMSPLRKVINSKVSPVKELVNMKISPAKVSNLPYQHVSGCEEHYKSVDDEIEIKTPVTDLSEPVPALTSNSEFVKYSDVKMRPPEDKADISDNELKTPDSDVNHLDDELKIPDHMLFESDDRVYVDSLGRRGKKRGRRSRQIKAALDRSESEESASAGPITSGISGPETRDKTKTPDNEITISKDDINSKEALQLIDGSSFQRFYKMRTRRQNSSNEQTPGTSPVPNPTPSTTPLVKRRSSSRSNSSNSKNSEETPAVSGDAKKRPKHVKPDILCSFCLQTEDERGEEMISCCLCGASGHPSCLQFSVALTQRVKLYQWECIECKKCELCRNSGDDATLLFCDDCDKGFHMSCLKPPLSGEPDGHWSCLYCVEGSNYWKNKSCKSRILDKSRKSRKSDKVSKRKQLLDDLAMFHEAQSRAQAAMTEEAKSVVKPKSSKKKGTGPHPPTIKTIELGCYEITAWYSSPYPAEYAQQSKLYICEFCLKYMKSGVIASRHTAKCPARCPPGDEIYRKETISVFEVDGRKNKTYCQNLCLLAKLFLDHKTLYYDVEPFLFYILTEYDRKGCHIVGYFSKEKNSFLSYNVSCILVLPPYMKKGYGKMLIDFSYALSRKEGKLGSPEKPLSDLGLVSYRNYWKEKLLGYFINYNESEITIKHISQTLGFNPYDIVSTLQAYGMIKYHKSNHYVLKRPEMLSAFKRKQAAHAGLPCRSIDMSYLKWTPPHQRDSK